MLSSVSLIGDLCTSNLSIFSLPLAKDKSSQHVLYFTKSHNKYMFVLTKLTGGIKNKNHEGDPCYYLFGGKKHRRFFRVGTDMEN